MSERVLWISNGGSDEVMTTEEAAIELLDCIFDDIMNRRWGTIEMEDGGLCAVQINVELRPVEVEVGL